jgi:hypothetical protein
MLRQAIAAATDSPPVSEWALKSSACLPESCDASGHASRVSARCHNNRQSFGTAFFMRFSDVVMFWNISTTRPLELEGSGMVCAVLSAEFWNTS